MEVKFFTVPILDAARHNEELNALLRANKIVNMEKHLVQSDGAHYWCVCVTYMPLSVAEKGRKEKVDYMKVLQPVEFARFSKLRKARKAISEKDGVSAFVVFTDAELAEMARQEELTAASMKKIKGVGTGKMEKYAERLVALYQQYTDETDRPSDAADRGL